MHGVAFPESEVRQLYSVGADGKLGGFQASQSVREAMEAGVAKPDYKSIRVPVLAFYPGVSSLDELIARYEPAPPRTNAPRLKFVTALRPEER